MKIRNRIMALIMMVIVSVLNCGYALADTSFTNKNIINKAEVIEDYVNCINNRDWERYRNCFSNDMKEELKDFPSLKQLQNEQGILSVKKAQISGIKQISKADAIYVEPSFEKLNFEKYESISFYYVGLNLNVEHESKYYYNGVNYFLFAVGKDQGKECILQIENAFYYDKIEDRGLAFETYDEKIATTIVKYRKKGIVLNGELMAIDTLSNQIDKEIIGNTDFRDAVKQEVETGVEQYAYIYDGIYEPEISVYVTSEDEVRTMSLFYYSVNVLPNEWVSSWADESIQAGFIAVKMYGWYNIIHTRYPASQYGADVTDRHENYQTFKDNSQNTRCTILARNIMNVVMVDSDNDLISISYSRGSYNANGQGGNRMYQYGTKYLADNMNMDYREICEYYFPDACWITSSIEE